MLIDIVDLRSRGGQGFVPDGGFRGSVRNCSIDILAAMLTNRGTQGSPLIEQ